MDLKSKINYANRCNRKEKNHHLEDIDYKNVNPAKVINVASSTTTPSTSLSSSMMTTTTTTTSCSSFSSQPNSNINRLHHQNQHNSQHYHHSNGNSTENNTNKRKRRTTLDEKESEYENPAKRIYSNNDHQSHLHSQSVGGSSLVVVSSSSIHNDQLAAAAAAAVAAVEEEIISIESSSEITRSSSNCLSAVADYDLGTPCSSTHSRHDDDHDISPTATTLTSSSQSSMATYSSSNNGTDLVDQNVKDWQQQHHQQICDGDNLTSIDRQMKCDANNDDASITNTDDYCSSVCVTPETTEIPMCPLPALAWANAQDVWNLMCRIDETAAYDRTASMLENHPSLQPRMRAILLDWLIELCEVYKLHRETYYLAVDYLDRYLAATKNVQKTHLQLIGITCLFVASKVEEIYPPKLAEFAYVTDGACQVEDILQHELLLLKALDWDVSPVTIMGWLGVYMQLNVSNRTPSCFSQNNTNSQSLSSHQRVVNSSREQSQQQQQQQQNMQRNVGAAFNNNNNCSGLSNISSCNSSSVDNRSNSLRVNVDSSCDDSSSFLTMTSANCSSSRTDFTTTGTMTTTIIDDSGVMLATPQSLMNDSNNPKNDDAFIYPQFSGMEFVQTAQLLDLCSMDVGIANFRYSVIAAAAMSYTFSRETALRVSGYDWNTIEECAKWMKPFFSVICEEAHHVFLLEQDEQVKTKYGLGHICPNIITDDSHIIQTHTTSMSLFDKLVLRREQLNTAKKIEASPAIGFVCPEGLLTPPSSSRKPPEDDDVDENGNGIDDIENENDDHDDGNGNDDGDDDEDNHYNHDHHNDEQDFLQNDDIDHENDDYNLYGDLNDIIDDDYDDDSGGDDHNENNVYKK